MRTDHFVKDYRSLVGRLKRHLDEATAMSQAVGGSFDAVGQMLADLLRMYGLTNGMHLIDLGCGSGRAAVALARDFDISYHGTDVVHDLIDYACKNTPEHYRYSVVEKIEIPADDACADMVCAFSLFTHLLHEETFIYLEEAKRVLKPGGKLVFSFLEFRMPSHWALFTPMIKAAKTNTRSHLNVFIERNAIEVWARHLDLTIIDWMDATQMRIPLSRPVTLDTGKAFTDRASMGQSVCVVRKGPVLVTDEGPGGVR